MNTTEWKDKYKDLIEDGRKKALQIIADYEEMANDLGEPEELDDTLTVSEKAQYLKDNELRHAQWLYLNVK